MAARMLFFYIFRQHLLLTLLVLLLLTFIVDVVQFAERSRLRGSGSFDVWAELQRIVLQTPSLLQSMLPYVLLVSTALLVLRMGRQYELAIFLQIGRPSRRVLAPLVVGGVVIGLLYTYALNPLASVSRNLENQDRPAAVAGATEVGEAREIVLRDADGYHFLLVDEINAEATALEGVTYLRLDNDHRLLNRVNAPRAAWLDGELVFSEARDLGTGLGEPIVEGGSLRLDFPQTVLTHKARDRFSISVYELPGVIAATRLVGASPYGLANHFQNLIALPALLGAISFLAGALIYHPVMRGQLRGDIVAIMGTAFAIYFLVTFTDALGGSGAVPPAILAWGLPVVFGVAGVIVLSIRSKRR
ncbi:MAG: LptF/LptG family permease [Pseudomonadota bacterium]